MKKIISLVLALMMILSLATTAFAATVSNETTGHSYNAYQVFAGTQAESEGALGDVTWGTGVNGDTLLTQLKEDYNYFDECTTAADVANVLAGKSDNCEEAKALANAAAENLTSIYTPIAAGATEVELANGYWLLVDVTVVDEGDARNNALLQVTTDIQITKKYTVPSVDKTIKGEGEAADAAIDDTVTFVLTATLPNNVSEYDTYTVVFHDTMSKGLTYTNNVVVTIDGKATNGFTTITGTDADGNTTITVSADDVKDLGASNESVIVVEYTATVNSDAVIGATGNPNEVYLEYSNDPNWDSDGDTDEPTGETPKDEVIIFVYELDVDKVNNVGDVLQGAEFVLLNSDKTKIAKVADGKLVEWVDITTVTNNPDGTYPAEYTLTSDEKGEFAIAGLDAGTYYLRETKAPAGYNKLTADIKIEIEATITDTEDAQSLDKLTISVDDGDAADGNVDTGVVETDVVNQAGTELPETGGIGTTMFYVIGGILVLAAVVLLITKKRMATAE